MKSVYCLSNNKVIKNKLKVYIENNSFQFKDYNTNVSPSKLNYLLIIEPYKIQGFLYTIHGLWKDFLRENGYINTKLIVADFNLNNDQANSNYLDLTNIPVDFEKVVNNAKTLDKANWNRKAEKHTIQEKLKNFFKGHGSESLFLKLNYLRMSIINIEDSISGDNGRSFKDSTVNMIPLAHKLWKEFLDRWESYRIFFECMPFLENRKTIEELVQKIQPFFNINEPTAIQFLSYDCLEAIDKIVLELNLMGKYVQTKNK